MNSTGNFEPPRVDAAEKEIELLTKGSSLTSQKYVSLKLDSSCKAFKGELPILISGLVS